jgi:hypothetical protein
VEALRSHVVCSTTDIAELSIRLMAGRPIIGIRGMMIGLRVLFELLPFRLEVFLLRFILYQIHFSFDFDFGFGVLPMLIFNTNSLKGFNQG